VPISNEFREPLLANFRVAQSGTFQSRLWSDRSGPYNVLTVDILQRSVSEDGPYNFLTVDALRGAAEAHLLKKIYEIASKRRPRTFGLILYYDVLDHRSGSLLPADQKTT